MKFTVDNKVLAEAIRIINFGVGKRTGGPPPNLLVQGGPKGVVLTSMDSACCVRSEVPVIGALRDPGDRCIPLEKLALIVPHLTDPVELEADDHGGFFLRSGKTRSKIPGIPVEAFPDPGIPKKLEQPIKVNSAEFTPAISAAALASAKLDIANFALRDVHLKSTEDCLIVEGCDGAELMRTTLLVDQAHDEDVLVPGTVVQAIEQILKSDKVCRFSVIGNRRFMIKCGPHTVVTRTSAIDFPAVSKLIPESSPFSVTVSRVELSGAIKKASIFTDGNDVRMDFGPDGLVVSASSQVGGEIASSVDLISRSWNDSSGVTLAVSGPRLMACLSELKTDQVEVSFGDSHKRVVVKPVGSGVEIVYVTVEWRS